MIRLIALFLVAGQSTNPIAQQGYAVADRLLAAIQGKASFQDSDFTTAVGDADKAALRRFGTCKANGIDNPAYSSRKQPNVFVRDFSQVGISFDCKHVPRDTPAGITLHLQDGKITQIETHNADLMRDE